MGGDSTAEIIFRLFVAQNFFVLLTALGWSTAISMEDKCYSASVHYLPSRNNYVLLPPRHNTDHREMISVLKT